MLLLLAPDFSRRSFMDKNQFLRRAVGLTASLLVVCETGASDGPALTVDCSCRTKNNPSWCEVSIGEFSEHAYVVSGFRKPGPQLDAEQLATFCKRHADAVCQCDDVKYFKGTIRP